eukprot:14025711-Alexandrium_andersonii.AAC.1
MAARVGSTSCCSTSWSPDAAAVRRLLPAGRCSARGPRPVPRLGGRLPWVERGSPCGPATPRMSRALIF